MIYKIDGIGIKILMTGFYLNIVSIILNLILKDYSNAIVIGLVNSVILVIVRKSNKL